MIHNLKTRLLVHFWITVLQKTSENLTTRTQDKSCSIQIPIVVHKHTLKHEIHFVVELFVLLRVHKIAHNFFKKWKQ